MVQICCCWRFGQYGMSDTKDLLEDLGKDLILGGAFKMIQLSENLYKFIVGYGSIMSSISKPNYYVKLQILAKAIPEPLMSFGVAEFVYAAQIQQQIIEHQYRTYTPEEFNAAQKFRSRVGMF